MEETLSRAEKFELEARAETIRAMSEVFLRKFKEHMKLVNVDFTKAVLIVKDEKFNEFHVSGTYPRNEAMFEMCNEMLNTLGEKGTMQ